MVVAMLRDTKYLAMKTTNVFFSSALTVLRQLTAVQKASVMMFYYPAAPDVTALLKAVYDTSNNSQSVTSTFNSLTTQYI